MAVSSGWTWNPSEEERQRFEHSETMRFAQAVRDGTGKMIDGTRYAKHGAFWMPEGSEEGPIVCECGGRAFENSYGSYEVFGKCVACGKSESIYSG